MVSTFTTNNNHAAVNLGQLKYVAAPFYDVLSFGNLTNAWPAGMLIGPYPWSADSTYDSAIANLGQLKYLFSFDLAGIVDPNLDSDGDGYSDYDELNIYRTDPYNNDIVAPVVQIVRPEERIIIFL